ncbi:MAG TPA: hypothetical protein VL947_04435, partial [Cytophagales bacterium]|nr:hypothetical protein [Cytophagales bacterium]
MKTFTSIKYIFSLTALMLSLALASSGYGQTACSTVINTTNVTCPGGKDGTVEIITYGPNGQIQTGLCRAPMPAPYTCATVGCTRTIASNSAFELTTGETVCVQVANFNQNITFNGGGHLVFCGTAAPANINFNGNILTCKITVLTGANVNFNNLNNIGNSLLQNYGTITFNATGYNGKLENNGTMIVKSTANINAMDGDFTNNGTIQIQGSFNIFNTLENYGTITVAQDLNVNTNSGFRNYCTLTVTGNMMIAPTNNQNIPNAVENYGKITVGQQ